jgi:hypothetical protein
LRFLIEVFRVHFPDSKLIVGSGGGQAQQNLGICGGTRNSADWNLAEQVINQSKIRWALSNFKSFKLAGTYGIVPAHLQQGEE